MKRFYKLEDFIDESDDRFDISGVSPLDGEQYEICSSSDCLNEILDQFGERSILMRETVAPMESFAAIFTRWKNRRGASFAAAWQALNTEYDPIENYNMKEIHSGSDTTTDKPTDWKQTETQTPTDWKQTETQTPTNWKEKTVEGVGADGYHETETQTPTGWSEKVTEAPGQAGYHEIETQTPTDWKEKTVEGVGADGYHETETQTPTDWKESKREGVDPDDGYAETDTQTPTDWIETTSGEKADNEVDGTASVFAFNSATAVDVSKNVTKASNKTEVERSGSYETKHEITGAKITDTERTGTYETDKEITGSKETETEQFGTFQTDKEITGSKDTTTIRTGTYETDKEITGSKEKEIEQLGTYQTETAHTGTYKTETAHTGTYEKETAYDSMIHKTGNIGVMAAVDLIEKELELRRKDFVLMCIREFIDIYTVYC